MHVEQSLCPRALVQIVYILSDDKHFARPLGIEPRQGNMRGVRRDFCQARTSSVIELMHQFRIASESLGSCDILDPMPFPQTVGRAKGLQAALG